LTHELQKSFEIISDELTINSFCAFLDSLLNKDIEYSFELFSEEFISPVALEKRDKK